MTNDESLTKHGGRRDSWHRHDHSSFRHSFVIRHSAFRPCHSDHHTLAPIAQIRVRLARANGRPMSPAAGTLLILCLVHLCCCLLASLELEGTHEKYLFQLGLVTL